MKLEKRENTMVTNDLNGNPFQLKFVRAAQMQLFADAICDPPLGSTTVVPHGETVSIVPPRGEPITRKLNSVRSNSLSFYNPADLSPNSHGKQCFGTTVMRTENGVNYVLRRHRQLLAL